VAEKSHYLHSPPPAQPCRGRGKGGCYLYGPEDLLNKNELHLNYLKSILKMAFVMKTSKTKKFVKIFCQAFLTLKKYFA
jgi:hypothetical protein